MKKKRFLLMISLLAFGLILGACGNESTSTNEDSDDGDSDVVTLTFWNRYAELRGGLEVFIKNFEEEHPNIKIDLQETPSGTAETQLRTALSESQLPDLWTNTVELKELIAVDAVKNLDEVFTDEVRALFHEGTFFENGTTSDGSVYGFPLASPRSKAMMAYYNKDVFEELGLTEADIPASWEEFEQLGNQIVEKSGGAIYPLVWNNPGWANDQLVSMMGTAISPETPWRHDFKEGVPMLYTQGKLESAVWLKDMLDKGLIAPESVEIGLGEAEAIFAIGGAAFLYSGDWVGRQLSIENEFENWGVAPLPTKDGKPYYYRAGSEASSIQVSNDTEHWEEVKTFLEYAIEHFHKEVYVNTGAGIPAKMNVEGNPPFEQAEDISELQEQLVIPVPKPGELNPATIQFERDVAAKLEVAGIGDAIVGYLTGNIDDLEAELEKLDQSYKDAFFETLEENSDVSQEDYIFPNWEPFVPFTNDMYEELK
ncbi:ABC transporter substrate-binding protein [Bacillus suaedae]|uniref:Carbohydrate ABC transporter substrate-binding protein n=1 Tax=Halalkalibacter suaedae TaxID=2822140 RepID=A0A941AR18_9BACI|nr:ABC transporter substrate-binding protein [Bacillus suaedae]MBP3951898.1 carbohydrate ABC transporter substrate-binding protein [Bacillus suaedae]